MMHVSDQTAKQTVQHDTEVERQSTLMVRVQNSFNLQKKTDDSINERSVGLLPSL